MYVAGAVPWRISSKVEALRVERRPARLGLRLAAQRAERSF
jgi:hypothetical protein